MAKMTRREVIFKGLEAARGAGIAVVGGLILAKSLRSLNTEGIRSSIHAQIKKAGWNEKPEIFSVEGEPHTYRTGPLKLASGCHVRLDFHSDDASYYGVADFATSDPREYILQMTGDDGKQYPAALTSLRNPTKSDIEGLLTKAGVTDCRPLPK